ncbi:MAG: hypothetical protein ACOCYT_04345 [Chloroflexota bacterium]
MLKFYRLIIGLLFTVLVLAACDGEEAATMTPVPPTQPPATETPVIEATDTAEMTPEAAEPAPEAPCFNLPEDDCAIIVAAGEQAAAMTAFRQVFTIDFSATGLEPLALLVTLPPSVAFSAEGTGDFTLDAAGMPVNLTLDLQLNGTEDSVTTLDTALPLSLVDERLFVTLPEQGPVSVPFNAETVEALELPLGLGDLLPIAQLLESDPATFGEFIFLEDLGTALNPSGTNIGPFVDFVRLDDTELLGRAMQVFEFTLDVRALLNSAEFAELIAATSGMAADDPTLGIALQLLPVLLDQVQSELVITQYVSADDGYIHKLTFDLGLTIDIGALLSPSRGDDQPAQPIDIALLFDVELSEINEAVSITAPEDARLLTVAELQTLLDTAAAEVEEAVETVDDEIEDEVAPEVTPASTPGQ